MSLIYKILGEDGKEYGPATVEQIRQWIRDGRLNAQTPAQREGTTEWQQLSAFAEFADLFPSAAVPGAPATSAPPAGSYAAPGAIPSGSREAALSAVKGPAIALIVVASLAIACCLFGALGALIRTPRPMPPNLPPQWQSFVHLSQGPLGCVLNVFFAAAFGFILLGAIKMLKLQNHTFAIVTCILALLPWGCCCILTLPFGIWGLVVLNKTEVKSQFS